jgi:Uncharacterized oxidoreductases, Fe-dependent alcohol dehydrogenase family
MLNFNYHNHTEIIFGRERENEIGEILTRYNASKVLLHYGGNSAKKSGLYDRVISSLNNAGVAFVELGGVLPNPRLSLVNEGIEICRKENVDFILAIGGGSVIDSAKTIAMGVPYEGDVWDFFRNKMAKKAVSLGVILTIPAAGSESSQDAVITNDLTPENNKWSSCSTSMLRPRFAVLNPELSMTLPSYQTAAGATDITVHLLERYFTNDVSQDLSDRLIESNLQTVIKYTPIVLKEPNNYNIRSQIMWAGTLAHNNLFGVGRTGDWASHNIEHELSAVYDVTHGAGLAVITPAWMEYVMKHDLQRFIQMATRLFGIEYDAWHPDRTALAGIKAYRNFLKEIGMPSTLSELGIPSSKLEELADRATAGDTATVGNFVKLNKKDILAILESCK